MDDNSKDTILRDVQEMVKIVQEAKYYGPYDFFDGKVWHRVTETVDGKIVLKRHRSKTRKSRNRLKR